MIVLCLEFRIQAKIAIRLLKLNSSNNQKDGYFLLFYVFNFKQKSFNKLFYLVLFAHLINQQRKSHY